MPQDMTGKVVVITGASSGIGAAAARQLARSGATVVPVGGTPAKAVKIAAELGTEPFWVDYTRLADVHALAQRLMQTYPRIDVLLHNAGAMFADPQLTEDGNERTLQVNYLSPFLLQSLLHERLRESSAHVVITTSTAQYAGRIRLDDLSRQRRGFTTAAAYADTKLALVLFARQLARRTPRTGISAVSVHPGLVRSNIGDSTRGTFGLLFHTRIGRALMIDNEQGAEPLVHLATLTDPLSVNGQYFHRMRGNFPTAPAAYGSALAQELWDHTEALVATSGAQLLAPE